VSTQRSGSNWVEDRLDSHPDITMVRSEPFRTTSELPDAYQVYRRQRRVLATIAPPFAKASFVAELLGPATSHPRGFRVMYDQLRRNPSLLLTLRWRRVRVIHLVRANVLATHVSALLAKQSGVFVTRQEHRNVETVHVPTASLVAALDRRRRRMERFRWLLAHSGLPVLEVAYEDYVSDADAHDHQISAFLGVQERPLDSTFERLSSRAVAQRISNRDEVAEQLGSTVYRRLLDRY
jgi:Sulfotransferase family